MSGTMYEFERAAIADGDAAFGVPGTFRIHSTIYVTRADSDAPLIEALAARDYIVSAGADTAYYHARKSHQWAKDEILGSLSVHGQAEPLSLIVDLRYADGHRHALTEPDLHRTILGAASHPSHLGWYSREHDRFHDVAIGRMGAFVRNLVDVEPEKWDAFVQGARYLHAQEFIKGMAAWASRESDLKDRTVFMDTGRSGPVSVKPTDRFKPRGPGFFYAP